MENNATLQRALQQPGLRALLFQGNFGLRMEGLRVLTNGRASQYPYPTALGSREQNPYLTSGVSDNLMELNAVIVKGSDAAVRQLQILQQIVDRQLASNERLWPLTMPPAPVYRQDLAALKTNSTRSGQTAYDHYLIAKYGIKRLLLGGVHVGYSVDRALMDALYTNRADTSLSRADFQNQLYFKLAQAYYLWQWLFTYLYGASPVSPEVQALVAPELDHQVRSFRNSAAGFANLPDEQVDYTSFDRYINSLADYLEQGTYRDFTEFFGPVCLHGRNNSLEQTVQEGVQFISMRGFDTDPFAPGGMSADTLNFLELLLAYYLVNPLPAALPDQLTLARQRNQTLALQDPQAEDQPAWMATAANRLIEQLDAFCTAYDAPRKHRLALKFVQRRLADPSLTLAGQLVGKLEGGTMLSFGLKLANDRYRELVQSTQPLGVIAKGYSVTAQELIRAAIVMGIKVWLHHGITLINGEHREELPADLELATDAQTYLKAHFPEVG